MSNIKAALKAAKSALDAKDYDNAICHAKEALSVDPTSYFAKLFLGRAYDKRGEVEKSISAYEDAAKLKPNEDQAWRGLQELYQGQGGAGIDGYIHASVKLAEILAQGNDMHKCQSVVDKMVGYVKNRGTKAQQKTALRVHLPTSSVYGFLEGRIPHPGHTYSRLAEITEQEEKQREEREVEARRTRIGARKDQVVQEVRREIFEGSDLDEWYQGVIDWTEDDATRRKFEEKLLQRSYDHLLVLPGDKKQECREKVLTMAHGMVIIKHTFALAWDIEIEWTDVENTKDRDKSVLYEYVQFFPEKGLSKVLRGYLASPISPFPPEPPAKGHAPTDSSDDEDDGGGVSLVPVATTSPEDVLVMIAEGLSQAKTSTLAHRLAGEYYNYCEEYETAVETLRSGLKTLASDRKKSGLPVQSNADALNNLLGNALIQYQTPRYHGEARTIFNNILARKPNFTSALIGVGLILEEDEEYEQAVDYLSKALKRDPKNIRVGAELAWCRALCGQMEQSLKELEKYSKLLNAEAKDLRAQVLYRIGKCQWDLDPSRASRKDRSGAYAQFLAAIKANIDYAPAYTMLGIYYSDYGRDRKRARQCFQKAFELSSSETLAAERLARSFADHGDWDIVEIISQRVVNSGKTKPPPGSKKKGLSWPYSALGVVQMNRQEYQQAIVSFLAALRISPDDYHSYVGLGESYHNSGRYNPASRTFAYAQDLAAKGGKVGEEDAWFTSYMLANVNRELGDYAQAITGYQLVLDARKQEFGVEIALLQTFLEQAWRQVETGFFGGAIDSALAALGVAESIAEYMPAAFNLWKAVADALALFSVVQDEMGRLPRVRVKNLLAKNFEQEKFDIFEDNDAIGAATLVELPESKDEADGLRFCLTASILAHKRAIVSCAHDRHAQAVSWYNLGWSEYRAHLCLEPATRQLSSGKTGRPSTRFLKASMRCFKRAIELEAGNTEFWNALGVVTVKLNPKVAQHALVRSLHLNERNVKAWTNLGVLYLLQNDLELAHQAFARAQSTDPDYAPAWVGEGFIALLTDHIEEALLHFNHAFEISESGHAVINKQYIGHNFDALTRQGGKVDVLSLIQPLFALRQLSALDTGNAAFEHLAALYYERTGAHDDAITALTKLCTELETEFEESEDPSTMANFAQAKADLARNLLANHEYATACEEANTALDLSADDADDASPMPSDLRYKIRLSARLTLGLASYYLQDMDTALSAFRSALQESSAEPDVTCLLAEVLWARGGTDERSVAKEQLFECVQKLPGHAPSIVLLGAMAVVEEDTETAEAVREELEALRVTDALPAPQLARVETVLETMALVLPLDANAGADAPIEVRAHILEAVMLYPWKATGWRRLAAETEDAHAKEMALRVALNNVPPRGELGAEELCDAFAQGGTVAHAQAAVFIAPWRRESWEALRDALLG